MAIALLTSCQSRPPAEDRSNKLPTATEVFHLRSECARLGEKIMEENLIGGALSQTQESHYDPKTNRCYVQLAVMTADMTKPQDYYAVYLYDGQTREILATASVKHGEKAGVVFVPQDTFDKPGRKFMGPHTGAGFAEATEFINKAMEDDHRQ